MDTSMDPRWAASAVPPTMALQGNLDPLALVPAARRWKPRRGSILAAMRGRPSSSTSAMASRRPRRPRTWRR
jgi:uroporphyrinogen decarboxylase